MTSLVWICGWVWRIWVHFPGLCFPSPFEAVPPCTEYLTVQPGKRSESPNVSMHFWSDRQLGCGLATGAATSTMNWEPGGSAAWHVPQHGHIPGQICDGETDLLPLRNISSLHVKVPWLCWWKTAPTLPLGRLCDHCFCLKCLKGKWNLLLGQEVSLNPPRYFFKFGLFPNVGADTHPHLAGDIEPSSYNNAKIILQTIHKDKFGYIQTVIVCR